MNVSNNFYSNQKQIKILEITISYFPESANDTEIIRINSMGLINGSLRNKRDRKTYFGYLPDIHSTNISEDDTIDFLLKKRPTNVSEDLSENDDKNIGRFFQIKYDDTNNNFYIKDLGKGLGTFVQIQNELLLKDSSLINIGESYLVINYLYEEVSPENNNGDNIKYNLSNSNSLPADKITGINGKLKIRIYEGKSSTTYKEQIICPTENKTIRIGRVKHNNDVELNDNLVSKTNSIIRYKTNEGWFIQDGDEFINEDGSIIRTNSTNGTWFLPIENFLIDDGMIFKGNNILFSCHFVINNTDDNSSFIS